MHHLVATVGGQTFSGQWTSATTLSSVAYFWLGMLNVTVLIVFLSVAFRRDISRDRRHARASESDSPLTGLAAEARSGADESAAGDAGTTATLQPAALPDRVGRLLVSDAERDHATNRVCRAIAEGRLTIDEGMARVDKILHVRRRATLEPIVADIPAEPDAAPRTPPGIFALRAVAVIFVLGAIALQVLVGAWALWPVAVASLVPLAFAPKCRVRERGASRGETLSSWQG